MERLALQIAVLCSVFFAVVLSGGGFSCPPDLACAPHYKSDKPGENFGKEVICPIQWNTGKKKDCKAGKKDAAGATKKDSGAASAPSKFTPPPGTGKLLADSEPLDESSLMSTSEPRWTKNYDTPDRTNTVREPVVLIYSLCLFGWGMVAVIGYLRYKDIIM
eukprot:TRINITY_DN66712_c4_g3_i1.p1 TRINITY_DN66712_c4_g3~~TRINITY_DN66712_c4_g3_i1.p1  ORF type:complete len:169 (+),score=14.70 TRINITY_DN66712_c4_g3_i1:24-509(+)